VLRTLDGDDTLSILKTGIKDGPYGLVARGLSVIQRWNEKRFIPALLDEIEEMRSAGKIRDDFNQTDAGASSLREFLEMIGGKPDEERFRAFCALFMSANAPDADSKEAILDVELMSILRSLSGAEMHLLSVFLKTPSFKVEGGRDYIGSLSKELGHDSRALVERNVKALLEANLVESNTWENLGGTVGQVKQILTDLGMALRTRTEKYNKFKARPSGGVSQEK
jgi:predicted transcriptional regulator